MWDQSQVFKKIVCESACVLMGFLSGRLCKQMISCNLMGFLVNVIVEY